MPSLLVHLGKSFDILFVFDVYFDFGCSHPTCNIYYSE